MTDKQIIIDDVDVSGCQKYPIHNKWQGNVIFCDGGCKKYPNCYYKQLKRKEQECDSFKEILKDKTDKYNKLAVNYDAYVSIANKQLDQLKAENETLKAEYTRVHTQLASQEAYMLVDGEEVWSGPTRKLKQENEKLKAENEKLKQYKEVVDKLAGMQVILKLF